jgi:hypothetical protein
MGLKGRFCERFTALFGCTVAGNLLIIQTAIYSAFNRGGNRERSVQPEQHLSRITGVTADSGMSQHH